MQAQSPFASLAAVATSSPMTSAGATLGSPVSLASFPSAFAAFASQLRTTQLQTLLQSQVAALQSRPFQPTVIEGKRTPQDYPPARKRVGGSTVKTAKVWRFFDELPTPEQAAECRICRKKIKATNSSTTGMIRHLRSCHVQEYQLVQEARQSSMIVKMELPEEKARAKLLREMNDKVTSGMVNHVNRKEQQESQKSPSASSSASDTASSTTSSLFAPNLVLPPLPPSGLPAPKALKPLVMPIHVKCEATEVEEEVEKPTDLTVKTSAFSALFPTSITSSDEKADQRRREEEQYKIHMQVALMLLLDQHPPQLVDRPGFRSLIRFILPDYHMPSATVFQSTICPQLLNQMRQQIGAIFNVNNPISNPFDDGNGVASASVAVETFSEPKGDGSFEEQHIEVSDEPEPEDDDCESASSIDCEANNFSSIEIASFLQLVGNAAPQEELTSLLSVVHNVCRYFEARPQILAKLLTPPVEKPSPLRELEFVSNNMTLITAYIREHPDMELLPLSTAQSNLLAVVVQRLLTI
ncbi:unnamed protein product [Caenorhabditis auriculariae]|uniref:BED-type domain-containing protein n=1 Tax=Caenorhabditis auriculariae TaxID=2777116 RepID=A0A8S1HRT1_9PELO|nr:unnamed protein product [Caenorhabditis auriculariae]